MRSTSKTQGHEVPFWERSRGGHEKGVKNRGPKMGIFKVYIRKRGFRGVQKWPFSPPWSRSCGSSRGRTSGSAARPGLSTASPPNPSPKPAEKGLKQRQTQGFFGAQRGVGTDDPASHGVSWAICGG